MLDHYMTGRLIDLWFAEDIGACDLTVQSMIDADAKAKFRMNAREPQTVAGLEVGAAVFRHYDPRVEVTLTAKDGDKAVKGTSLMVVSGPARSLLTAERTALNIVQHMSGIATETASRVVSRLRREGVIVGATVGHARLDAQRLASALRAADL